jgi:hypothetical protein
MRLTGGETRTPERVMRRSWTIWVCAVLVGLPFTAIGFCRLEGWMFVRWLPKSEWGFGYYEVVGDGPTRVTVEEGVRAGLFTMGVSKVYPR